MTRSTSSTGPFKGSPLLGLDQGVLCVPFITMPLTTPPCSGLIAYRELTEAGLDVRIFERDSVPGGNWHYTEEVPLDAPAPNAPTPIGDFVPSLPPTGVELPYSEVFENDGKIHRDHRGPKPIWESLTCNAPSVCWSVSRGSSVRNVDLCSCLLSLCNRWVEHGWSIFFFQNLIAAFMY